MRTLFLTLITCLFVLPAHAKYSGGTGEPNDPYQIATAAGLIALGNEPNDYDKHFILTADIDLDPNLPGRKVFYKTVISSFRGTFDGRNHVIANLTITTGGSYVGLFGLLAGEVKDLGVADVNITGWGDYVGGLVASSNGAVTHCWSSGVVSGPRARVVGGLVGSNWDDTVSRCYSTCVVSGRSGIGGLVGWNSNLGLVTQCYSTGAVSGNEDVGGLVGANGGVVTQCYSTAAVRGCEKIDFRPIIPTAAPL